VTVFVDTSALLAYLNGSDAAHDPVRAVLDEHVDAGTTLRTTNYVLVETWAVAQRRLGLDAVARLEDDVQPLLSVRWIDGALHRRATAGVRTVAKRQLSLVDYVGFIVMRDEGLQTVVAVDADFAAHGFRVLPNTGG
jgi:predicted nucleic acid-binding protein